MVTEKIEENILNLFQEHCNSGSKNTSLIRQIIRDNPEAYDNKRSKISTKDDSIKYTNYSTKNIESDSIEYMHFLFVNFLRKSKQILQNQESNDLQIENNNLLTVSPCEEIEIE